MVAVDGELRQDRWQQEGQNRSKIEIVANYLQLLGGNPGGGGGGGNQGSGGYNQNSAPASQGQGWQSQGSSAPAEDNFADDIPF
jgi:single-strand DNA-binding protein